MARAVSLVTGLGAGRTGHRVPDWALPWLGSLGFLAVWELVPRIGLLPSDEFPPVSKAAVALVDLAGTGDFWTAVWNTMQGWALGLGIATLIAVPIGIAVGSLPLLYRALRAVLEFLRPIPSVALIPLAVLVLGVGLDSKVFLAAFASTWPILMQSLYGAQDVDPVAMDTARSFRLSRRQRLLRVTIPSAVPYIATGMRISSSIALILAVTAELVIGSPGLGREINLERQGGSVDDLYALIAVTGLLGWLLNSMFVRGEQRVLRWHPSHREREAGG